MARPASGGKARLPRGGVRGLQRPDDEDNESRRRYRVSEHEHEYEYESLTNERRTTRRRSDKKDKASSYS